MSDDLNRDADSDWHDPSPAYSALHESPLAGLIPTRIRTDAQLRATQRSTPREQGRLAQNRLTHGLRTTMPIVLVGSLALSTIGIGTSTDAAARRPQHDPKTDTSDLTKAVRDAVATMKPASAEPAHHSESAESAELTAESVAVPSHYTVKHGDTVSEIAGRFHLATATVLALNGLGWKSKIFPGQVLRLTKSSSSKPAPPVSTPPSTTSGSSAGSITYTIKSGDTITSIAKKFDVSINAILKANGLTASSVIYAGRTLIIPAASSSSTPPSTTTPPASSPPGSTSPSQVGGTIVPLSPSMKANAITIVTVGQQLNVPAYGIIIALAAAAQESGLKNIHGGDKDSIGLFQQRPSMGWGTVQQLENTTYATELFFGGPSNPNKGKTRGLLDIKGWQSMTLTQAAQAVEISGNPNAYAKWQASATAWYAELS